MPQQSHLQIWAACEWSMSSNNPVLLPFFHDWRWIKGRSSLSLEHGCALFATYTSGYLLKGFACYTVTSQLAVACQQATKRLCVGYLGTTHSSCVCLICAPYLTGAECCRWQYIDKFRKRGKETLDTQHMADLMDRSNIMEVCCGVHRPEGITLGSGGSVFVSKCTELGVVPNSRALEMLSVVRKASCP
jgi:hypothetical protein